jgi:Protein of unknown function (DUF3421)
VKNGVPAGSPNVYVGGGTFASQSGPALLDRGGCFVPYNGISKSLGNCEYLVNEPGFQWIPSSNGIVEPGAVMYGGVPVGRARHTNGLYRVGKISQRGLLYPADKKENTARNYDALVFKKQRLY